MLLAHIEANSVDRRVTRFGVKRLEGLEFQNAWCPTTFGGVVRETLRELDAKGPRF